MIIEKENIQLTFFYNEDQVFSNFLLDALLVTQINFNSPP